MLRDYQKEAVSKIEKAIVNGTKKIKIEMAVGTGRFFVLAAVLQLEIVQQKKVLIVTATNNECEQVRRRLHLDENAQTNYDIMTYISAIEHVAGCVEYNIVVFDGIHFGEGYLEEIFVKYAKAQFIGFTSIMGVDKKGVFAEVQSVFSYSYFQALQEGQINRFNSDDKIMKLVKRMLLENGFTDVNFTENSEWGDIEALLGEEPAVFEIRNYRDKNVEKELVYSCVESIVNKDTVAKDRYKKTFLVMFCIVDTAVKDKISKEFGIIIWDIRNIKYLCTKDSSLSDELAECVRYSLVEVKEEETDEKFVINEKTDISNSLTVDKVKDYEVRLKSCPVGNEKGADSIYENICVDIIKELFEPALENFMPQKVTRNKVFRMDLICTIKAETGLWWFLKHFYRTNYIVFEFKNCKEQITQNNIVVTEKYLNPYTLRNVAIIVSRKGFNINAQRVAISELHKRGYLIIDVTTDDLMRMLSYKQKGGKPEDMIQDKIDQLLMEIDV